MAYEITIDTGGTFTDGVLLDDQGMISIAKSGTTLNIWEGIIDCLRILAQEKLGMGLEEMLPKTSTITVGTTIATNTILQSKGAKACMVCTKGFRDVLELRRVNKENIYDLRLPKPRILIPRFLRFEVEERIGPRGEVITPLNEAMVREVVRKARDQHHVEVAVICFLHSYSNTAHERRAAEIVKEEYPEVEVILSSKVLPRPKEFERFSTAAVVGYAAPSCLKFVKELEGQLRKSHFHGSLLFLSSDGGVVPAEIVPEYPELFLLSGQASAPLLASFWGEQTAFKNMMVVDMGGTSLDIGITPGGQLLTTTGMMMGDQRIALEVMDVKSIGAGGGSIAGLDARGILYVGPESAGGEPGPACYGKGNQRPTVTDADLLLGYIPADYFLGGKIKLDPSLAEKAIRESIAEPLGIDPVEVARKIYVLINTQMADAILLNCVRWGYDPREFIICAGGGAGAVHAVDLARKLGMKEVYIPKLAAVFSALGILKSDFRQFFTQWKPQKETEVDIDEIAKIYKRMETEGIALLERFGVSEESARFVRGAEMRYRGQIYDIKVMLPEVPFGTPFTQNDFKALVKKFHEVHQFVYGYSDLNTRSEMLLVQQIAIGKRRPVKLTVQKDPDHPDPSKALKRKCPVYFEEAGGFIETFSYDGDLLRYGNVIEGPARIEEATTTVIIPPKDRAKVDPFGNYIVSL
jgi:N-methylhydantoinase A